MDIFRAALEKIQGITEFPEGVRLNTHCMYPSGSFVRVTVRGAGDSYSVSDEGGAFREAEEAGAVLNLSDRKFAKTLHAQGLYMKGGVIASDVVRYEALPLAIAMVGNASKEVADWIFEHLNVTREVKFKDLLRQILRVKFSEVREQEIVGVSDKPHRFDNVVQFMNGSRILIDAVVRDANSINSRVVANLDVLQAKHENLQQAIIYDDEREPWDAAELKLLGVSGVPIIAYSKSPPTLEMFSGGSFRLPFSSLPALT